MAPRDRPRVLLFDVFGTCVDWRGGIAREGEELGRRLGISGVDWAALADAWRAQEACHPLRGSALGAGNPRCGGQ